MRVNHEKFVYTYHKSFKIRSPPLGEAVAYFPLIVDAMRSVELARINWWGETLV